MMGATARRHKCSHIPLHCGMCTIWWILRTICWILRTFWHKFAALAAKRLFGGTWEVGWVSVKGGACATPVAEDLWQPDWAWYQLWDTVLNTFEGKDRNQVRWAQLPGDRSANPGRCRTCLILRLCHCATRWRKITGDQTGLQLWYIVSNILYTDISYQAKKITTCFAWFHLLGVHWDHSRFYSLSILTHDILFAC